MKRIFITKSPIRPDRINFELSAISGKEEAVASTPRQGEKTA